MIRAKIRGYTNKQSVEQGGTIDFCLSNPRAVEPIRRPIRIIRLGRAEIQLVDDLATVWASADPPARPWENNQWAVGYTLRVGQDWLPGVYVARIGQLSDDSKDIFFVVKNSRPGTTTSIVIQIPTMTINAYNNWGAKSLYGYNSISTPAHAVSFNRPQQSDGTWPRGYGFEEEWESRIKPFVRWMELAGYGADFITSNDLHDCRGLDKRYRLFVSIGHDEYWSHEMRRNLDNFRRSGGNVAIFGGNTCYWQVRLEADEKTGTPHRRQVCYKSAREDPIGETRLKTVTWREVGYPENTSFGAGWQLGAWRGNAEIGAFVVHRPDHWAFFGTGLRKGDSFGNDTDEALLCYETNGVDYLVDEQGRAVPTGADGTPLDYTILALADLPHWATPGNAAMGVLNDTGSGGTVFNAGTTDWAKGLERCLTAGDYLRSITAKITRNVVCRLASGDQDTLFQVLSMASGGQRLKDSQNP